MSYAKEYDEALSRLNAPERSPLPYAPIPYGPVPNKCNYANWNRIMYETRQGNLPKYSIMQRCNFDEQNILNGGDPNDPYFRYRLDPSFTFAKGDRKSIAIREVKIIPPLEKEGVVTNVALGFLFEFGVTLISNGTHLQFEITQNRDNITSVGLNIKLTSDFVLTMQTMAQSLADKIWNTIKDKQDKNGTYTMEQIVHYYTGEYIDNTFIFKLWIKLIATIDGTTTNIDPDNQLFYRDNQTFNRYVNSSTLQEEAKRAYYGMERDKDGNNRPVITFEWKITDRPINYSYGALCSDINPWTAQNVISGYEFQSDSLTKIYPYNGSDEVKFWFLDLNGNSVKYNYARGYVDLELIIDNSNSFAMDN